MKMDTLVLNAIQEKLEAFGIQPSEWKLEADSIYSFADWEKELLDDVFDLVLTETHGGVYSVLKEYSGYNYYEYTLSSAETDIWGSEGDRNRAFARMCSFIRDNG